MISNYEEFVSEFLEALEDIMPEANFERAKVEKVNETKDAIRIQLPENKSVIPTIYLDEMYKDYQAGVSPDIMAERVSQSVFIDADKFKEAVIFDKEKAAERLFPCAINKELNKNLLSDIPYKDIEGTDLALIARYKVQDTGYQMTSFIITKNSATAFGMEPGEVLDQAIANGAQDKYVCKGISESIADEMRKNGMPEEMIKELCSQEKDLFYVLTNEKEVQGAAVLAYLDEIKKAVHSFGEEKCYILPSSIHEVLLVPESTTDGSPEQLADIVKEVNDSEVKTNDQLSNHVYFFDGKSLSIADTQTMNHNVSKVSGMGKSASKNMKKQEKSKGKTR